MDIRENVKIRSLRAKFIRHVVLVSVQRVSGLLLSDLVNTTTHIQDDEVGSHLPRQLRTARANRTLF